MAAPWTRCPAAAYKPTGLDESVEGVITTLHFPKFRAAAVQTAPVWLDLEATVEQTCDLIREAAVNGARLVAFPEVFIPGYPYWLWMDSPLKGYDYFVRLYKNSVRVPSDATERLCAAARESDIYVVVGINEIDHVRFGTIYNTNLFIDRHGRLLGKHRKLIATFAEKMIWGRGDGSTLRVYDTDIGRLGGLNCGESLVPKLFHDITGHYNRFDVLSLAVSRDVMAPLHGPAGIAEGERADHPAPTEACRLDGLGEVAGGLQAALRALVQDELTRRSR